MVLAAAAALVMRCRWRPSKRTDEGIVKVDEGSVDDGWQSVPIGGSELDDALVILLELGDAEYDLSIPKSAVGSASALKRQIVKACLKHMGRKRTPAQWLTGDSKAPTAMSVMLTFDDQISPPLQVPLTPQMTAARIRAASCVHVLPT